MKAVLMRAYGSNDRVAYADVPNPHMGPDDVLIDVHAAGINPIDYKTVRGMLKPLVRLRLPVVLGNECAGLVAAVGSGVVGVAPGDAVFTRVAKERLGTFAQQVAVDHRLVAPKPANCSFEEAASLPLVGLTCWQALVELAQLKPREQVLIHGGSGGVGTFAIQLAHYLGARIATTAGGDAAEWLHELGAETVIDYHRQDFSQLLSDVDVVFDTVGGEIRRKSYGVMRPGGRMVSIADLPDPRTARELGINPLLRFALALMNRKNARAAASAGVEYRYLFMRPNGGQLREIARLVEGGQIRPHVDRVFPLSDAVRALDYLEHQHPRGKVVLGMV